MSINASQNGKYAVTYSDSSRERYHDLHEEDYGPENHWVLVKK